MTVTHFLYNNPSLKGRRKELRAHCTEAERHLWLHVNKNQLKGYRYFRQYSAGPYILDFFCPRLRLAIELDGDQHRIRENKLYDQERELFLQSINIKTIRFWNEDVMKATNRVVGSILEAMKEQEENPSLVSAQPSPFS